MVAQARPKPAAAAEQYPARSTREEVAQDLVPRLVQAPAQASARDSAQVPAQGPARVLVPEISASQDSAPARAPELAEAASPAWPVESANWKKRNCTASSGCSPSSVKLNQPKILTSTHCRGG